LPFLAVGKNIAIAGQQSCVSRVSDRASLFMAVYRAFTISHSAAALMAKLTRYCHD
jgi:hypothetical protein